MSHSRRARLLRGSDRTVLWEYHADAPSKALDMNLSVLTSVAAKELRLEVDQAIGALARDIVLQAFGDIATMPPASSEPSLTITDAGDNEAEHK